MYSYEEVSSEDCGSTYTVEETSEGWEGENTFLDSIDPFLFAYIDKEIPYTRDQQDVLQTIRSTDGFPQEETEEERMEILEQFPLDVLSNIVLQIDCAETLYIISSTFKRFRKAINSPGVQGHCKALSFAQHYSLVLPTVGDLFIVEIEVNEDFVEWYEGIFYTKNSDELQKTYYDVGYMNFLRFDSSRPLLLGKEIECGYVQQNVCVFSSDEHIEKYLSFFAKHGAYEAVLSLIREISSGTEMSAVLIDIILSSPLFPSEHKELVLYLLTWVNKYVLRRGMSKEMEVIIEKLKQFKIVFTVDDLLTLPKQSNSCINNYSSSSSY